MSRIVFDGHYTVTWLDVAPANPAAPTVTEITAGTNLTSFIPKDGFNPGVTNNRVTGGALDTTFTDESMGTWTSALVITAYLDSVSANNTAYDTLSPGATGCIVVTPFGPAVAAATAYVWPDVECGVPVPMQTAENARQKFTADLAVRKAPVLNAVIAGP